MNKQNSAEDLLLSVRDDPEINAKHFARNKEHIDHAPDVGKHGRWEKRKDVFGFVCCSACHDCNIYDDWADGKKWNYCPNCGAKMDGDGDG